MFHVPSSKFRVAGVSTLPTMLLLGGIIIEIAIAVSFLAYYFNTLNFSTRLASEAIEAARAGAQDAIIKIILNKNCPNAACPANYSLTTSNGRVANVTLSHPVAFPACSPDPANPATTQTQIDSAGSALNQNRRIRAMVSVNCLSGQTTVLSFGEI